MWSLPLRSFCALALLILAAACEPLFTDRLLAGHAGFIDERLLGFWTADKGGPIEFRAVDGEYVITGPDRAKKEAYRGVSLRDGVRTFLLIDAPDQPKATPPLAPGRLFYVMEYNVAPNQVTLRWASESLLRELTEAHALPAPASNVCDKPTTDTSACTPIYDITLSELANAHSAKIATPFDSNGQSVLTRAPAAP
ncbi:MAG: hypothetical protein ABUL73_04190 [Alphaproteobacteria bacterium]